MKKVISSFLALILSFSLVTPACATSAETNYLNIPKADIEKIFTEFNQEIKLAETQFNTKITSLNEETFALLKKAAINDLHNESFHFADLIDSIVIAQAQFNIDSIALSGDLEPGKSEVTVYRSFGPLRGKHIVDVSTGTQKSQSGSISIGISAKEEVFGIPISMSISASTTYSVSGPSDNSLLNDGKIATHRTAFGVLYGTILKHRYLSPTTGDEQILFYVDPSSKDAIDYTVLTQLGVPTYVDRYSQIPTTLYFANQTEYRSELERYPALFLP